MLAHPAEKNRAKPEKQKGKKEGGWGEGIFALLRLRLERFRFPLIKRKPKQKIFHLLLKEKNGGQKKIKNVMKKFLFWFAIAEPRQAETHLIILGSVQKKLEFQPKGTANSSNEFLRLIKNFDELRFVRRTQEIYFLYLTKSDFVMEFEHYYGYHTIFRKGS